VSCARSCQAVRGIRRTHTSAEEPSLPRLATGPETELAARRDLTPRSRAVAPSVLHPARKPQQGLVSALRNHA
jgi:hypothetical protein